MYIRDLLLEKIGLKDDALAIFRSIERLYLTKKRNYVSRELLKTTKNFDYNKYRTSATALAASAAAALERAILEDDPILKFRYFRIYAILKKLSKILYEVVQAYRATDIEKIRELDELASFYLKLLEQDKVYATIKNTLSERYIVYDYKLEKEIEKLEIHELGIVIQI